MSKYKHILTDFKDLRKVIGEVTKAQPAKSRYQQQAEKMKYTSEESKYIKVARDVVKKKSAKKVDGVLLDLFTASAIIQVYDAVNSQNKKRMDGLKLKQLADIAFKLASGKKEEVDEKVTVYSIKNTKTGQTYASGKFPQSKSKLAKIRKGGGDHKYAAMHKDGKVQKEEGNFDEALEAALANESDLGLTYKKGKTVQVTHKTSGKELIIIDKPSVRKEYEKIGYYAEEVGLEEWKLGDGRPRGSSHIENIRFWDLPKDKLEYIKKDSDKAMKANPNNPKNTKGKGNYADQINDADTVLAWRKKKGIKEEVGLNEVPGTFAIVANGISNLKKADEQYLKDTQYSIVVGLLEDGVEIYEEDVTYKGNSILIPSDNEDIRMVQSWAKNQTKLAADTAKMIKPNMDYNDLYEERVDGLYVAALLTKTAKPNRAPKYTVKFMKEEVGLEEAVSHNRLNTIQKDSVKALFRAVNQADGVKDRTAVAQSSKEMERGTRAFQLHFDGQNSDVQEVIAKAINKVMKKSEMFIIWDAKFSKRVASFGEEVSEGRMKDLSINVAHVYKQMKKDFVLKPFADKFKADVMKSYDIYKSLEKVLPDYVSGGKITALMKDVKDEVIPSRSKQVKEEHEHAKQSPFKLKTQQYPRAVAVETDGYGKRHATVEDIISACDSFGMIIDKELQVEQVQKQLGKKGFITYKKSELEDVFEGRETQRMILVLESELEEQSPTKYTKDQIQNALDEGHEIEFLKPNGQKTVGPVLKLSGSTFNVKDKYTGKSFTYKYSKIEEEKVKTFNEVSNPSDELDEGKERSARQLTNPDKEVMVVKKNKVIVISKKDQDKYLKKGWSLAEGIDEWISKDGTRRRVKERDQRKEKKLKEWEDAAEASGGKAEYQKFFNATLKKFGVSSPAELEGKKKKEFFDYIDKNWTADHEEVDIHKSYKVDGRRANFREKMKKLGYIKSQY